jgi:hypothetical protein
MFKQAYTKALLLCRTGMRQRVSCNLCLANAAMLHLWAVFSLVV